MNLQLKTAQMNPRLNSKINFFLNQAAITEPTSLKQTIWDYVSQGNKYLLFRHSSLYFFANDALEFVEETIDNFTDANYLRFDGEKVTRIDPEYYLGALKKDVQSNSEWSVGYEWNSNNNNNNNNNNNGNNNG